MGIIRLTSKEKSDRLITVGLRKRGEHEKGTKAVYSEESYSVYFA